MRTPQTARRGGFTLVEVLVVVSLIAVLAAITAGAVFRLVGSQESSVTETTLSKIASNLDTRWKAVRDEALKSVPADLVSSALCGGDRDRAKVIWVHAKLRNEFPQTWAEANGELVLVGGTPGVRLRPRKAFQAVPVTATTPAPLASAALIYASLTQTGGGGNVQGSDGLQQQVTTDPGTRLTYFRDSWGTPIGFVRFGTNAEVNKEPFTRPVEVRGITPRFFSRTVFDPYAKMVDLPANAPFRLAVQAAGIPAAEFDNVNSLPTLYSAGPNKEYGADPLSLVDDEALDNLFSYRTRREGARGD